MSKKSIRFFNDREVRAVWDEEHSDNSLDGQSKKKAYTLIETGCSACAYSMKYCKTNELNMVNR